MTDKLLKAAGKARKGGW